VRRATLIAAVDGRAAEVGDSDVLLALGELEDARAGLTRRLLGAAEPA
jgi:hypothetical protein